ncbi:prion-inhibition and propagation-domain-containing protein [Xylaria telfairii]|nr:prion-inhibition and propagation-domain-containing protein [Xylaria telfairii]
MVAEVIGIIASVVSICQMAKAAIDLYEIISDVKETWKDLEDMLLLFQIERVRFFHWCDYVGLTHIILMKEADERDLIEYLTSRTSSTLKRAGTCQVIADILRNINRNFQDANKLLSTYLTTKTSPPILTRLKNGFSQTAQRNELVMALQNIGRRERNVNVGGVPFVNFSKRVTWAVANKAKLHTFISNLRRYNNGLRDILSDIERSEIQLRDELLATTSEFGSIITALPLIEGQQSNANTRTDTSRNLVQLMKAQWVLDHPQCDLSSPTNALKASPNLAMQGVHLLLSDINMGELQNTESSPRLFATYKGRPCLIEWKYYSRRISQDRLAYIKQRASMLVLQFQLSAATPGFSILDCVGQFEDRDNHRIGLVFQSSDDSQTGGIVDLRTIMLSDRTQILVRDLGARIAVARALVMAFFRLHQIGWVHKSFRSENVLLVGAVVNSQHNLGTPYICGFDCSRPDTPDALSEGVPTQLLHLQSAHERSLYRHPDLWQQGVADRESEENEGIVSHHRYRKSYDTYSLGVVLVEIALWHPVTKLIKQRESPTEFYSRLLTELVPELGYRMGRAYQDVVDKCLRGHFGDEGVNQVDGISCEEHQRLSRQWMRSFLEDAVEVLESRLL